ncbi:Receptor-type tyrosine-protein phosphatase T [Mizuhopecten yessoensis]|uniref:protein-tyrosine-phosphatase n=1 Tax=Mizuhopecten yessoensis TaxID=6573 RepID=A0A210QYK9_MIZYE|nr:Receptor-type tyrosine-protein phosphatase T [Mizuhopecten yessoensis]
MDLTPSISCKGTIRYLTIFIDRSKTKTYTWYSFYAVMEICEVEVYGCPLGKYGDGNCLSNCDRTCVKDLCDPTTGRCNYCSYGSYKDSAVCKRCPVHCLNGTCDVETGICLACEDGFYGSLCGACATGCSDPVCDKIDGKCSQCEPGYHGTKCEMECPSNCTTCLQTSGQCTACSYGLYSSVCDKSCPATCKDKRCDINTGQCTDCVEGFFGLHCNVSCPSHCTSDGCEQKSGDCLACKTGYYGLDCEQTCGQCLGSSCGMTNGSCRCVKSWEGDTCKTRSKSYSVASTPVEQTGLYAGAGVGATVVIALVTVVVIIIVRRKNSQRIPKRSSESSPKGIDCVEKTSDKSAGKTDDEQNQELKAAARENEQVYVNLQNMDNTSDEEVVYKNVQVTRVPVNQLSTSINSKMANNATAFKEEFQTFPLGAMYPHEEGEKVSNKSKNRFKTTFPYDHSRVILNTMGDDDDSSYINANYIDSVDTSKVYIASQGPKTSTVGDFWRMLWQVNSGKIVMLTNLVEGAKVKCHQYWPDEGTPLSTDTFDLTLDRERTYACYVIRDISIVHKQTKEERQVHHFHFTTWPDHGTPDTLELVLFHRRVTLYQTQLSGQMVVHCSAGIGRTGTFIALDALLTYGKTTGVIDIPSYIGTMRKNRMNMIQTYEQYIALHELLIEGFNLPESYISRSIFNSELATLCLDGRPANFTKLFKEFERLQSFNPNYTSSCYSSALLKENENKNRDTDILAVDKFRAYLQSQPSNRTNYINAVIIPSHTSRFGYLMTQFPLENTVDDFWTMVFDYNCDNIVVIGTPQESCWLPVARETSTATYLFKKLNERSTDYDVEIADYQVTNERSKRERTVQIFNMKQWSSESLLSPSDSSLLQLLEQLDSRRRSDNTTPVVVMCRNGCTQSGLFCCISNLRDQIKMDDGVDIFQTARQLKTRQPEALRDVVNILDYYMFIFISECHENFSVNM